MLDLQVESAESLNENGGKAVHSWLNEPTHVTTGVREYQQGDRFAWVDWKTTARRGQLMTKEFEQNQTKDLVVFADFTDEAAFETVVSITASVLQSAVKKEFRQALSHLVINMSFEWIKESLICRTCFIF